MKVPFYFSNHYIAAVRRQIKLHQLKILGLKSLVHIKVFCITKLRSKHSKKALDNAHGVNRD